MKLFLLFLCVASSYATDFNCLKGPSFWCASLSNAQKCGRVSECFINKQIKKDVSKVKNIKGVECELCEKIVSELEHNFIPQLTEQQFIDYVVNNVCSKLSNEYKTLCVTMIRQYGHDVYIQLKQYLDPAFLCQQLHYCATSTDIYFKLPASPETCKICKEVFGFVENLLNGVSPAELKALLKLAICGNLPAPAKEMCNTLVDGYTDQIYELLKSLLDGDRVCPAIHLCSSQVEKVSQPWNCKTCEDVVAVLRTDLAGVSVAELEDLLKNMVCSKLPFIARGFCDDSVQKYVPQFYNDIHSQLTPQQICAKNAMCMLPPTKKLVEKKSVIGAIECDACEMVVGEVKRLLLTEAGEIKVKNFIENKVCRYFGSQVKQCVDFVEKYGDILINFINNELTNRQICELFGACTASSHVTKMMMSKKIEGVECEACTLVLTEIKKFVSDPNHETILKNFLKNTVCSLFPNQKTQCQQVIDEYFNIIFNAFMSQFDVTKVCQALRFCSAIEKKVVKVEGVKCDVCEVVMQEVIDLVTTNASQQHIMTLVATKLCPKLGFLGSECVSMVNTYVPILIKIARESLNSKILCSRLNLCALVSEKNIKAMIKSMDNSPFQCKLCQFIVNETRSLLSNPSIQTVIENFIKNDICSYFGSRKQECINDINEYYSFVINMILEFMTPALCQEIRVCSAKQMQTNMPMLNLLKAKKRDNCEICSSFYKFLKSVTINTPNNDIVLGLVGVCGRYYHEEKNECLNLLKNVDGIFESFKNANGKVEFCEMAQMCVGVKRRNSVVGQRQCSWGPAFWCLSRVHADLCGVGAVRHCEDNVWKNNPTI